MAQKVAFCKSIGWIPIVNVFLMVVTLVVSYLISYKKGIAVTRQPFIRAIGTIFPASCWFALLLSLTAYALLLSSICGLGPVPNPTKNFSLKIEAKTVQM